MSNSKIIFCILLSVIYLTLVFIAIKVYLKESTQSYKKTQAILVAIIAVVVLICAIIGPLLYQYLGQRTDFLHQSKYFMFFIFGAFLLVFILAIAIRWAALPKNNLFTTKNIARLAVFTAISSVLYNFIKFPLPFIFPAWLDIQFSDMPALLAGFMMGPEAGAIVIILKVLIKLPLTTSGGIGELADLILGLVYVLSASIIYQRFKSKKGAIISLIISSIFCVFAAVAINRFIIIPFYTSFIISWNTILGIVSNLYKGVTKATFYKFYLWLGVLPFNILRCLIVVLITFFMYKPTKRIFGFVENSFNNKVKAKKRT